MSDEQPAENNLSQNNLPNERGVSSFGARRGWTAPFLSLIHI